jgi:hypothetical protein
MRRFSIVCWPVVVAGLALAVPAGGALADKARNDGNPAAASKGKARGHEAKSARGEGRAGASEASSSKAGRGHGRAAAKTNRGGGSAASRAGKITICHATGSATNPFVLITVSANATTGNGHGNHEDDLIPAPSGGCPDGAAVGAGVRGGGGGGGNGNEMITICHATHSETNPFVLVTISINGLHGHAQHGDDIIPAPESGVCAGEAGAAPANGSGGPGDTPPAESGNGEAAGTAAGGDANVAGTAAGGVAGAVASGGDAPSGILGTLASGAETVAETLARENLPFTGLPLWIPLLLGVGLAALGIWIRARARAPRLAARNQTGS